MKPRTFIQSGCVLRPSAGHSKRSLGNLAILLLMMLTSCTPGISDYGAASRPGIPEQFTQPGSQSRMARWWGELNDPCLEHIIDQALEHNLNLSAIRERLLQARAVARRAGAELFPKLDAKGAATSSTTRKDGVTDSTDSLLLGLAAAYELDLWGRVNAEKEAARHEALARDEDVRAAALSLAAQIANVWYRLAASLRQLELLQEQQQTNIVGLEIIRLRFNAGQAGSADVLQQRELIEAKNGEQAEQRASVRVLEHQLAILSGVSPGLYEISDKPALIDVPPLPHTGVPLDLLTNRPDVRSRYLSLLAADRRMAAAVADRYPRLAVSSELTSTGTRTRDLFDNWLASLAANIVGPLIDGGARRAEVDRTASITRERLHAYGEALITAVGEVEDALVREHEQSILIASLTIQLDLATQALQTVRDRYKQGAEDYQRVLLAQLSQQRLQHSLVGARLQLISYRIDLYRALGTTGSTASISRAGSPYLRLNR